MLRFEAIVHNTAELRCGRMIEKFPEIVTRLAGIADRFATALDCVDTGFIGDGILDELPTGTQLGATRVGGVDLNKPRMHDALRAALALAPAPERVHRRRVHRQGARPHRHHPRRLQRPPGRLRPAQTARQTARRQARHEPAATTSRHPPRAPSPPCSPCATRSSPRSSPAVRSPRMGRKPAHWTRVDRDYERIRIDMQTLFSDLAIETPLAA